MKSSKTNKKKHEDTKRGTVYCARILNPVSPKSIDWLDEGYLVVSSEGLVIEVVKKLDPKRHGPFNLVDLRPLIIMPGLVDAHAHIPQYAFAGIGHLPLLEWLKTYTFPHEESFSQHISQAKSESLNFFNECLSYGTTTVVAYATSGVDATNECFKSAQSAGIRAFIGLVLMDSNSPKSHILKPEAALKAQEQLIKKWHRKDLLNYVVSPRFALSCSRKMLEDAGELSRQHNLLLQTHISENPEEVKAVLKMHAWAKSYADVYAQTGCLNSRALLGHGVHLSLEELKLIAKHKANIVHCPTSNRFLGSGAMPLRRIQNAKINVTLGSDVAGGYSLSIFNEMREACETSKTFGMPQALDPIEAFFMATMGAAKVLGLEKKIGCLAAGFDADFIVVDDRFVHPLQNQPGKQSAFSKPHEILSRLLYRSHPQMVRETFVKGERKFVAESDFNPDKKKRF